MDFSYTEIEGKDAMFTSNYGTNYIFKLEYSQQKSGLVCTAVFIKPISDEDFESLKLVYSRRFAEIIEGKLWKTIVSGVWYDVAVKSDLGYNYPIFKISKSSNQTGL